MKNVIEYPFPEKPSKTGFRLFEDELENDPLVFFHGTDAVSADQILVAGFKLPEQEPCTVSFGQNSAVALHWAMQRRASRVPGDYRILVVRYDQKYDHVRLDIDDAHDSKLDPPPMIIGLMTVPASYPHDSTS